MSGFKRTQSFSLSQSQSQPKKKGRFLSQARRRYGWKKPNVTQVRNIVTRAIYNASETKLTSAHWEEASMSSVSPSGYVYPFPIPAQGVTSIQRIANKCYGVGLASRILLHNNSSNDMWVRLLLLEVYDGQQTDAEIISDLFEGETDSMVGENGDLSDTIKKTDRESFKCLKDSVVHLTPQSGDHRVEIIKHYHALRGQLMNFNDKFAARPIGTSRFVWVIINREADSNEGIGSTIEAHVQLEYYFKD